MSLGYYRNIQVTVLFAYRRNSHISKPNDTHPVYIESHKRSRTRLYGLGILVFPVGRAVAAHSKFANFTLSDLRVSK